MGLTDVTIKMSENYEKIYVIASAVGIGIAGFVAIAAVVALIIFIIDYIRN